MLALDHITVICGDLAEGVAHVEQALGIAPPAGGKHPHMGTHNHLMKIGAREFLEVIAIDPDADAPARPRWFGLDEKPGIAPYLGAWVVATDDIQGHLAAAPVDAGTITRLSRGEFHWDISIADNGRLPLDGAFPTVMQWGEGVPHPATNMPDLGLTLTGLTITHPEADKVSSFLSGALDGGRVTVEAGGFAMTASFETPNGPRTLG